MADDGKKGRGSKPRVQGKQPKMYPGQNPSTYTRTVGGKAQGPKQVRSEATYGYNLYNQYGEMDAERSGTQRYRPRTASSKSVKVLKRVGRGTQAGSPSKKGRTVAGQTNPMKGRGGTSGKPKGN